MTNQPEQLTDEQKIESVQKAFKAWKGDYELLNGSYFTKGSLNYQIGVEPSCTHNIFLADKIDDLLFYPGFHLGYVYLAGVSKEDSSKMRILKGPQYLGVNRESGETLFVSGKPAKMIKKILPYLSVQECQDFALWWKDTFEKDSSLTLHTGKDRESFNQAYTGKAIKDCHFDYRNSGIPIKSLNGSCMQGDSRSYNNIHPAETYASGDFLVVWTQDSNGLLHSRCVVHEKESSIAPGPIYTASKAGVDKIEGFLNSFSKPINENNWLGAKLLKIEMGYNSESFLCPYLDCRESVSDHSSKYLVIDGSGVDSNTDGYISFEPEYTCEGCGNGIDEDSTWSGANGDGCYCESCYNDLFFYCNETQEIFSIEDGVNFYTQSRWGKNSDFVCKEWASENGAIPIGEDNYYEFDMLVSVDDEYYLLDSDDIFISDKSDEYSLIEEKVELPNGECWSKSELEEETKEEDCPWRVLNGSIYLKDNWEYNGGKLVRNPTLDLE